MSSVRTDATEAGGETLVTVVLDTDTERRVRVESRLDGPVWPPRTNGVPEAGWDETGVTLTVPAAGRAVGFASPAPPRDPPVVVRPAGTDGQSGQGDATAADATAVVRELGDPAPPREAVPLPSAAPTDGSGDRAADERPSDRAADESRADVSMAVKSPADEPLADESPPSTDPVAAWLDRVEARVADAERVTEAETVPETTAAVREVGGLDDVRRLTRATAADRRRLLAVARRAEALANRSEATDVPLAALERLA
jgi:hypothetical protein